MQVLVQVLPGEMRLPDSRCPGSTIGPSVAPRGRFPLNVKPKRLSEAINEAQFFWYDANWAQHALGMR